MPPSTPGVRIQFPPETRNIRTRTEFKQQHNCFQNSGKDNSSSPPHCFCLWRSTCPWQPWAGQGWQPLPFQGPWKTKFISFLCCMSFYIWTVFCFVCFRMFLYFFAIVICVLFVIPGNSSLFFIVCSIICCCYCLFGTSDKSKEEEQGIDKWRQFPCWVSHSTRGWAEPGNGIKLWPMWSNNHVSNLPMASKCDKIIFWKETSKKRRQEKLLVILLSQPQEPGMFDGDRKNIRKHKKSLVTISHLPLWRHARVVSSWWITSTLPSAV